MTADAGAGAGPRRLFALGVAARSPEDDPEVAAYWAELGRLAESAGAEVAERYVQVRSESDPHTYVGPGVVERTVQALAQAAEAGRPFDGVLLAHEVAPRVLARLGERLPVPVEDRTRLILGVFARRARSAEGRLQVELARLSYELPRLPGRRRGLSRQGGAVGMRGGAGESALELDRRRIRARIAELRHRVALLRQERAARRADRGEMPRVALVGYTNAGKTTLLGALAGRDEGGRDRLFDTLDPTVRRVRHPAFGQILAVDTVGFVRDLPPGLLEAFEATLAEVREADLLVHVVDGTSPHAPAEVEAVRAVLSRIGADTVPEVLVATHVRRPEEVAARLPGALAVDSPAGVGLEAVCRRIGQTLAAMRPEVVLDLPPGRWDLVAFARARGPVEVETAADGRLRLSARLTPADAARLRRRALGGG